MSLEWLLIRGSGLAAFALLGMAAIWGLLISTKVLGRAAGAKSITWFHESLSIGALVATVVHLVSLGLHDFVDFTWAEIFIPGLAEWRPVAVSLGVVSFYVLALVTISFYVKKLIGQRVWRALHTMTLGLYGTALAHGIAAGTDTGQPLVIGLYAAMTTATVLLLIVRLAQAVAGEPSRERRPRRPIAAREGTAEAGS